MSPRRTSSRGSLAASRIERRKIYEELADRLIEQIRSGSLKPGDPLPTERELAGSYGVGRSSVREALRILESKGLIQSIGSGTFVVAEYGNPLNHSLDLLLSLHATDLLELFEVRKILEVECATLAAIRRSAGDLAAMATAIDEMDAGLADQRRYIEADLQFHLTVASASGNRMALHMMQAIRGLLQDALASIYFIPGSPQRSIAQHRLILSAIAKGDADAARQHMLEHLQRVEGDVQHELSGTLADVAPSTPAAPRGDARG